MSHTPNVTRLVFSPRRCQAELLECVHADGLVGDHQERKRQVLGRVLASFSDGKGQPVDEVRTCIGRWTLQECAIHDLAYFHSLAIFPFSMV